MDGIDLDPTRSFYERPLILPEDDYDPDNDSSDARHRMGMLSLSLYGAGMTEYFLGDSRNTNPSAPGVQTVARQEMSVLGSTCH